MKGEGEPRAKGEGPRLRGSTSVGIGEGAGSKPATECPPEHNELVDRHDHIRNPPPVHDHLGNPLTCRSTEAVRAYDQAVDCQLHAWPDPLVELQAAVVHDPGFALAHAAMALVSMARGRVAEGRDAVATARRNIAALDARERSHIALVSLIADGKPQQALAAAIEHARHWPTDALAMSTALGAFGLFAFSGREDHDQARLAFVRSLAPHYPDDNAWMLTQLSWAHTEAGLPDVGFDLIQRSLALRSANGNAAHVMMHAHFERGETADALLFIDGWLPGCPDDAMLFGHLHWHAALCEIDLDQADAAERRLVAFIEPHLRHALPLVGMTDMASLLWRLGLQGRHRGPWAGAAAYAALKFPNGGNAFAEIHLAMLAAARRDVPALALCAVRLQRAADAGQAAASVALRWVAGLGALLAGDSDGAREHLQACFDRAVRLGGSHAQRTIVDRTLATLRLPRAEIQADAA